MTEPLLRPDEVDPWLDRIRQPVVLTGATGFVGSHLVDTLCAAGVTPRVLLRDPERPRWISDRPVEAVPGNLSDPAALRSLVQGARTVIHLAGVVRADRVDAFDRGNRAGTAALVEALAEATDVRLVHVSSLAAAGPSPDPVGIGPEAPPRPVSAYGRSKLAGERELPRLPEGVSWTVLRPPAIYGPRDTDVFEFFRMADRGLLVVPRGQRWLTVAWVGDVVRWIVAAAAGEDGDRTVRHLGEPEPYRLDVLLDELCAAGGVRARRLSVPETVVAVAGGASELLRRMGVAGAALTRDKARELVARHWVARTRDSLQALVGDDRARPFRDGAEETWRWYRGEGWLRYPDSSREGR